MANDGFLWTPKDSKILFVHTSSALSRHEVLMLLCELLS